jgi:hypothetical protein
MTRFETAALPGASRRKRLGDGSWNPCAHWSFVIRGAAASSSFAPGAIGSRRTGGATRNAPSSSASSTAATKLPPPVIVRRSSAPGAGSSASSAGGEPPVPIRGPIGSSRWDPTAPAIGGRCHDFPFQVERLALGNGYTPGAVRSTR